MKQSSRLILTAIFLLFLLILSRALNGSWFYWPAGDQSLWFESGLLMVVLGSFFIEKHFTKPVDVVANSIIGIVALLAVDQRDHFLFWKVALWLVVGLATIAFLSMAIQTFARDNRVLRLGKVLLSIATFFGSAKRLFSVFLFLSIFSFFQVPSKHALFLFLFWAFVISAEPLGIPSLIDGIISAFTQEDTSVGRLFRTLGNGIYQIEVLADAQISAKYIICLKANGENIYCVPLGAVVLSKKKLLTAAAVTMPSNILEEQSFSTKHEVLAEVMDVNSLPDSVQRSRVLTERGNILGIVDDRTDIEQLRFRLLAPRELQEGQLVKVFFLNRPVLYQVVNAVTSSSMTEGDEERYVIVIAQLIGVWDPSDCHFESIGWVAEPGGLVYAEAGNAQITLDAVPNDRALVGCLPQSTYPIHVNIHEIVTHHTAILGITGSGKTVLAYQLIKKMVEAGIKVLVFDVSGDYAKDLAGTPGMTKLANANEVTGFLDSANVLGIAEFAPTTTATLVKATAASVQAVLVWAKTHLQTQHGENINARVCVVFEEAHSLIPEWNTVSIAGDKDEVNKTSQAILQGRKYGVGALVITQRTANITKTILNQCNTIFALQSFDQTGLEFLKNYVGEGHAHALSTLLKRQVVIFGKASSSRRPVIAKLHETPLTTLPPAPVEPLATTLPEAAQAATNSEPQA